MSLTNYIVLYPLYLEHMVPWWRKRICNSLLFLRDLKGQFCQQVLLRHILKIHSDQHFSMAHIYASACMTDYNHYFYNYFCNCSTKSELMSGFYPSTFVYSHFYAKIQFLYCLLSSLSLWGIPIEGTKGKIFET